MRIKTFETRTFLSGRGAEYRWALDDMDAAYAPFEGVWERQGRLLVCSWRLPRDAAAAAGTVVASFAAIGASDYGYCVELEGASGKGMTCSRLTPVGAAPPLELRPPSAAISSDIDNFILHESFDALTLRLYLSADSLPERWIFSVSCRLRRQRSAAASSGGRCELNVPAKSQMLVPEIGKRICSPTSIAMLLEYDGLAGEAAEVALRAYCREHDLFGVWPWNIHAASRAGLLGFLAYFDDWRRAQRLLELGRPFVASIRYAQGELSGAAVERQSDKPLGHLVVVRGFDGNRVLVNDPGAATVAEVRRSYDLGEFLRVWLERSALAYVFPPPA